ncbi:MAG: rhomboid family intramembrane serine protease [Pseudomonadota bacterium]
MPPAGAPPAILALVIAIAAIEGILSAAGAGYILYPGLREDAFILGAFQGPLLDGIPPVYSGQPAVMFVSHAFLHANLIHMLLNMAVLLALGKLVAERAGAPRSLALFVATAITGAAAQVLIGGYEVLMIGASGAVFGFIGTWKCWEWMARRAAGLPMGPLWTSLLVLAGINVPLFFMLGGALAWEAHLGGFVGGWLLAPFLRRHAG